MTNSNSKTAIRTYMQDHGVNYTAAKRALDSRPIAYVRETWPIPDSDGVWDGNYVQLVVTCPFCPEHHHHGGYVSRGRDQGHRAQHCTNPVRDTSMGYWIRDARERQTVTPYRPIGYGYDFEGEWPGDKEPTVEHVKALISQRNWDGITDFIRTNPDLPPVTIRTAWEEGLGWDHDDDDFESSEARARIALLEHPNIPHGVRDDVAEQVIKADNQTELSALVASPAMSASHLANRFVSRGCGADHAVLRVLVRNPNTTADTLGWISEHATGFLHGDADVELAQAILDHPNLDDEVWDFFTGRLDACGQLVLDSPRCDQATGQHVFEYALWTAHDRDLLHRAANFLHDLGPDGVKYLDEFIAEDQEEYWDADTVTTVREAIAAARGE